MTVETTWMEGETLGFSFLTFIDGFFGRSLHCCE
jgi:hypothetical protein